jgi:hypothetical protein
MFSRKRERSSKSSSTSLYSNQPDLYAWLRGSGSKGQQGEFPVIDRKALLSVMCWGFRGPKSFYNGVSYDVTALIEDSHVGSCWCTRRHRAIENVGGQSIEVNGVFRHRNCVKLSGSGGCFPNLTRSKSISTLSQKGRLSKCALKGSKHALNFFRVALPHRYLAYWLFNLAYCQEYFQKWHDSLNPSGRGPRMWAQQEQRSPLSGAGSLKSPGKRGGANFSPRPRQRACQDPLTQQGGDALSVLKFGKKMTL